MENVSITAYWMAAYRSIEQGEKNPLFLDSFSAEIAKPLGFQFLKNLSFGLHYEWIFNTRTKVIDDLIVETLHNEQVDVVINLAAGFDMRPFRLNLDLNLKWVEIDHENIILQKNKITENQKPNCQLQRTSCDLTQDSQLASLLTDLQLGDAKVLILTEGLLIYLSRPQILKLSNSLGGLMTNRMFWIFDGAHPLIVKMMGWLWNPVLSLARCHFTSGIYRANFSSFFSEQFDIVRFYSLFDQAKKFNKAPVSVKIMTFFSNWWLPSVRNWYFGLSGIYMLDRSKNK